MAELLLELFSEEIPARMQAAALDHLHGAVTTRLAAERLEFTRADVFATPRRLTLVVEGLPKRQPDIVEEKKGPHVGAAQRSLDGFMKSVGLTTLEGAETRTVGGADYYYVSRTVAGRHTAVVLCDIVVATIESFSWPKSMRWGSDKLRWIRPLQNILCLFDGVVVDVALRAHNLRANDVTFGHRFLSPQAFKVTSFADYAQKLHDAYVVLDPRDRRKIIAERIAALASAQRLTFPDDPVLLNEVAGLVEWPVPLIASIDASFMKLPREVLTATMRANQKYFVLETSAGDLAPRFALVANMQAPDGGAAIVAGNERVLRARLSDAQFFWHQDRKAPLSSRVPSLSDLVFQAKLGTLLDKVIRIQSLSMRLAVNVGASHNIAAVNTAATLCKADLVTGMVGEFPELQGKIGRYYALADGEDPRVADAIAEHYAPIGPSDKCPTAPVSIAVALADKIDTLVGFFAIGEKPTGSKDPYGLRRAALGAIRLIVENGLRLRLTGVFATAFAAYEKLVPEIARSARTGADVAAELLEFFADRLKAHLRETRVRHDLVSAVFALGDEDDLVRLLARVGALSAFLASPDGANLLTAYKRASNIVRREESKDKTRYDGAPDPTLFAQPEETELFAQLERASAEIREHAAREDFAGAMAALARLRPFVDVFFDKVTVNADDPALRANRLRLLSGIRSALGAVADFSKIEG